MRVTQVELVGVNSDFKQTFKFNSPGTREPYLVKNIIGMDADEIHSEYTGTYGIDPIRQFEQTLSPRNIVIRVALNADYSINETPSDLRDKLYRMIAVNRYGRLKMILSNEEGPQADITGYISKMEANHFEDIPEVQITLHCKDPLFRSPEHVTVLPEVIYPPERTENTPPIRRTIEVFDNVSTTPHGFSMRIGTLLDAPSFGGFPVGMDYDLSLRDRHGSSYDWEIVIATGWSFSFQKYFLINEDGERNLIGYTPAGDHIPGVIPPIESDTFVPMGIGLEITPPMAWPLIYPGKNTFYLQSTYGFGVIEEITYRHAFWGV